MTQKSMNKISIASIIFCLFLSPCVLAAPAASSSATPAPSISPFAATGLLVRPDERAEEILLRAHARDVKAIILVIAGYNQGIGGFPKDRSLALAWGTQLGNLNAVGIVGFFTLYLWGDEAIPDEQLAARLANCKSARESYLTPLFMKAGIFDVDQFCIRLEKRKHSVPGADKLSRRMLDELNGIAKKGQAAMAAIRAFRDQPVTPETLKGLAEAFDVDYLPLSSLIFFAATTHDPEKETPDWSAERLFTFLNALTIQNQHAKPGQFMRMGQNFQLADLIDLINDASAMVFSKTQIRLWRLSAMPTRWHPLPQCRLTQMPSVPWPATTATEASGFSKVIFSRSIGCGMLRWSMMWIA